MRWENFFRGIRYPGRLDVTATVFLALWHADLIAEPSANSLCVTFIECALLRVLLIVLGECLSV